ncbi:uncharacterized protein A4U43_C07F22460 [Asparagus officinalis]|uniref:Uncharacterized protein n=1 Tax=Asparagus officinalis TaxID=4686 RepID=A0A5P1EFZ7_ASPOF|nr:uncharacterized protein A4U43_C07F22460 [Asparagus officinalis]
MCELICGMWIKSHVLQQLAILFSHVDWIVATSYSVLTRGLDLRIQSLNSALSKVRNKLRTMSSDQISDMKFGRRRKEVAQGAAGKMIMSYIEGACGRNCTNIRHLNSCMILQP